MNTGEPWPDPYEAEPRVRRMQAKLHRWAADDPGRRFDDLFNLVYDPAFLQVGWERVRSNKGATHRGVDRVIPAFISETRCRGVPERRCASCSRRARSPRCRYGNV